MAAEVVPGTNTVISSQLWLREAAAEDEEDGLFSASQRRPPEAKAPLFEVLLVSYVK